MRWLVSWQQNPGGQTNPYSKEPDDDQLEDDVEQAGAAGSRGSVSSFRSFASHFSHLSRMSGSSQRSYENPVLESVQTILDLTTKLEADNKRTMLGTTGRASMAREARKQCDCYEESLRRLKGQLEGYAAHPAVIYSGVHTSPKGRYCSSVPPFCLDFRSERTSLTWTPELVLLCDKVRQVDHGPRINVDTEILTLHSDLLDGVSAELVSWFDGFVAMPDQQDPEPSHRAYVSSPLKHEVPRDEAPGRGVCPNSQK